MTPTTLRKRFVNDENRRWWTLAAMCFALFMIMLDNTVVNVALPSIQKDLGASISGLEWTVNAYTLSFAVLLVTGGRLGDLFGRRRMFLFGVIVFGASSAFIGLAQSEAWLVTGRAVQGIGAAFMMPATLSIISNAFPPHERGKAIGTWAGVSALALAIGPVVGGFLVENVSWQSIFFLNLPVAALAVVVTLFATHESRDETAARSIDVPGVTAITVGLAAMVLALVEGNAWGWGSGQIVGLLATAVVGLAAFAVIETRSVNPMVDFRFFRARSFLGANVVAFIVSFAMLATFFFLALYLQNVRGYSPLQAGVRFLPMTVVIIIGGPIAGRLSDRIGPRPLMTAGLLLNAISLFWQGHLEVDTPYTSLLGAFILMGLGMGLIMSPMSTAAMNAVDQTKAGVASGVLSMSRMVGGTFGVAVMGALISGLGRQKIDELLPQVPQGTRASLAEGLGAGATGGTGAVHDAVQQAFLFALNDGLRIAAVVAALGAVAAWVLVEAGVPHRQPVHDAESSEVGTGDGGAELAAAAETAIPA
ncbi:MAG TPA: MFS transporter [Baekduia sp.]|uniref:MFS transporter n=1 Tax=Baekduia sp. TaxID=2600305 RepID=UPI002C352FBB|nr:MFS transporter [Baekduia sp.]HMJ34724.1 MFS transporter [Baekduia sp.]